VDLLPERSQESLVAWFERHPGTEVEIAARDRSSPRRRDGEGAAWIGRILTGAAAS
jgi:hypothetical protein